MVKGFIDDQFELMMKARIRIEYRSRYLLEHIDKLLKAGPAIGSRTVCLDVEYDGAKYDLEYTEGSYAVVIKVDGLTTIYDSERRAFIPTSFNLREDSVGYTYFLHEDSQEEIITFYKEDESIEGEYSFKCYLD